MAPAHVVTINPGEVALSEGGAVYVYTDGALDLPSDIPPVRRAVMVARLRALADVIEKTGEV